MLSCGRRLSPAALALLLVGCTERGRPPEAEIEAALAAGRIGEAAAAVPRLLAAAADSRGEPGAAADRLQAIAVPLFVAGGEEGWAAADRIFREILTLRERAFGHESAEVAATLEALAEIALARTDFDEAARDARAALEIRRAILPADDAAVADSRLQLAKALFHRAEYAEAESLLLEAGRVREGSSDAAVRASLVDVYNVLGETYRAWNRYGDAERFLGLAAKLAAEEQLDLLPIVTNNLAGLYRDQRRYAEAQLALERSLELREHAPRPDALQIATACLNLAKLYRYQGDPASASPYYERALQLAERALGPDHPELAWFVSQLATLRQEQRRFTEAEAAYRRALELRRAAPAHERAQTLHDLGTLLAATGAREGAEEALSRALELRVQSLGDRHPDTAVTRVELAELKWGGGKEEGEAERLLEPALAVLDGTAANPDARIDGQALRADIAWERGDRAAATAIAQRAVALVESLRPHTGGGERARAEFQRRYLGLYDRLVDWLASAGQVEAAFACAERARARVLLDQIALGGVDLEAGIPADVLEPLRQKERALTDEISRLEASEGATGARLAEAEVELGHLLEQIRNESPLWRALSDPGALSFARLQASVPAGAVLLSYHLGSKASWLFLVPPPPGKPSVHRLGDGTIEELLFGPTGARLADGPVAPASDGTRRGIGRIDAVPGAAPAPRQSERLFEAWRLLVPEDVRARLLSASLALVAPDGPLRQFPLEALVVDFEPDGRPRYWLDAGPPVIYVDSATILEKLSRRARGEQRKAGPALVSLADPAFASAGAAGRAPQLPALPETAREADLVRAAVRRIFPGRPIVSLLGADATEARLRAALPGASLVHLATHGLFDPARSELFASLALAAGSGEPADDGFLRLHELYGLHLTADLAVLSSCDGRVGRQVEGEGVFALARGFLAAGAERVVASLWRVDDEATAELIGGFFGRLADSSGERVSPDYARALRDAKRAVRGRPDWESPFFWAAFTASGLP